MSLATTRLRVIDVDWHDNNNLLGEAQALALVAQVALFDGLGLLNLVLVVNLCGFLGVFNGLRLLGRLVLGDNRGGLGDSRCLFDRLGLGGSLDGSLDNGGGGGGFRLSLLRDHDVLLYFGHFEKV